MGLCVGDFCVHPLLPMCTNLFILLYFFVVYCLTYCYATFCSFPQYVAACPEELPDLCKSLLMWDCNLTLTWLVYGTELSTCHMCWFFLFVVLVVSFPTLGYGIGCLIFTLLASHKSTKLIFFFLLFFQLLLSSLGWGWICGDPYFELISVIAGPISWFLRPSLCG